MLSQKDLHHRVLPAVQLMLYLAAHGRLGHSPFWASCKNEHMLCRGYMWLTEPTLWHLMPWHLMHGFSPL